MMNGFVKMIENALGIDMERAKSDAKGLFDRFVSLETTVRTEVDERITMLEGMVRELRQHTGLADPVDDARQAELVISSVPATVPSAPTNS